MKITKHRQEILDTLKKSQSALTASDIHRLLPHINLVTIYRNLEGFANLGIIKKFFLSEGEASFEFQDHPHHHAICDNCNKVIHFEIPEDTLRNILKIPNFDIKSVELVVHGDCEHTHRTKSSK